MTELKTLKDIEFEVIDEKGIHMDVAFAAQLRAEAIEWVKEFRSGRQGLTGINGVEPSDHEKFIVATALSDWIMHFFNLTEDDLK